jgi:hypothetical protein
MREEKRNQRPDNGSSEGGTKDRVSLGTNGLYTLQVVGLKGGCKYKKAA